jgi:hypothetical protein
MAYISFQPSDYFNTKLWTGDNTSSRSHTAVGFQPDWTWIKRRSNPASHTLFDAVRTAGSTKGIASNSTAQEGLTATEGTTANYGYINSFDSDGFTTSNGAISGGYVNQSSETYVAWNWKANGSGSANTDGSISSTVSANTTSGFSIVTYTGTGANATIGHGLGTAPSVVICKQRNATQQWINYHKAIGATKYLHLNATDASATSSTVWNDTDPTSSVFSVGTAVNCNGSGSTYIAYCFAEKKGFSKFGSYTGNGEASDNAFIYTGFKPAFVLIKATDVDEWRIYDNKRANPFNVIDVRLKANSSDAESSGNNECDFLSNGIKIRSNSGGVGSSGQEYIFMAFAEAPIVSSNGVPAVAR